MGKSVADHILEGSILVESHEALGSIVRQFPDNAHLLRLYAEMLATDNLKEAVRHYDLAAGAFLSAGKLLPAILSKVREWMVARPLPEQLKSFHRKIAAAASDGTPASEVAKRLSPAARMALFSRVEILCLPAGTVVRKPGEVENTLWAVVCGRLKESNYEMVSHKPRHARQPERFLGEGHFFGDIYPFSSEILSRSCVEAVTRVELVSFSKRRLIQISRKHPNLEQVVLEVCRVRFRPGGDPTAAALRQGERYEMPAPMTLEIEAPAAGQAPLVLTGRSRDISLSGLSFIPESWQVLDPSLLDLLAGRRVKVILAFEDLSLTVSGRLARIFQVSRNGRKTLAVGVRFSEIPLSLRGAFFALAGSAANGAGPHGPPV
jgi:CRP-like cAMP-binding protein